MAMESAPDDATAPRVAAVATDTWGQLLGDSYRPGGPNLTRRLAGLMRLAAGERVLDIACGRGAGAIVLAHEYSVRVNGIDSSPSNVALATGAADAADLGEHVSFAVGIVERLPFADGAFDAVVCERAFRTVRDMSLAVSELARVLRPGGRAGITDVTADPARWPADLATLATWVSGLGESRSADSYAALLAGAGLRASHSEPHDLAMLRMIDQIEARLTVARVNARIRTDALGMDADHAGPVLAAARSAVVAGALGYTLIIAEKPL